MSPGWNLGNQLEAVTDETPGETNWGNPVITEDLIKAVKAAGFQSIRIPVSYMSMIGTGPEYIINSEWLDRIQEVVDYCVNNDLYAVINMHGDGFQTIPGGWLYCDAEDQETIKAKFTAVWQQVATRFKDYDEHLIFESMNEVSDMSYAAPKADMYENINSYNQVFLDTIRQTGGFNDKRWVLIPGWNTDIEYTANEFYGFKIPVDTYLSTEIDDFSRIMISCHYYAPWDFCGGESGEITQWGENAADGNKTSTHSGQSFMAAMFKLLYENFTSKGYPVIIGEYGSIDKTEDDPENAVYREYFASKLNENAQKYGCISMYWDNGYNTKYGFGLFDRNTATVTQQGIIDAIIQIYQPVEEKGTSTGITLDQSEFNMYIGDKAVTLTAALAPADSTDTIKWASSDESVATVNDKGVVKAQTPGTTTITAAANSNEAVCTVNVYTSQDVYVNLYAIETKAWSSIQSTETAKITSEGGTFTLTMSGSADLLGNIGSLYIKDVSVQSGVAKTSTFKSAAIQLDSVKFNGTKIEILTGTEEAINSDSLTFDYCLLNQWVADSEKIAGVELGESGSYLFNAAEYEDNNTIEVTFTITDVVMP
jgi:endoglucanase